LGEIELARGADKRLDQAIGDLKRRLADPKDREARARRLVEEMAICLQASLLVRHGASPVAELFLAARLPGSMRGCYGALPGGAQLQDVIARAQVSA
jgi:putative acyl-CoA dehydrogenase